MAQIPIAPYSGTVAPLPNENSGMQFFIYLFTPPLGQLSKRYVSGIWDVNMGLKKGRIQEVHTHSNWKLIYHIPNLVWDDADNNSGSHMTQDGQK